MFSEHFMHNPLGSSIGVFAPMFPSVNDRPAWAMIRESDRHEILEMAAFYREKPYPLRLATDFLAFVRNGSRKADENPYFFRRRKLCAAVLGYCAEPNDADMDAIINGIWLICEESSWVISAHNVNPIPGAPAAAEYPLPDLAKPYIDLFVAQTAMILSLSCALLGEHLMPEVRSRVEHELRVRVLDPFMATDDFWWMGVRRSDMNNWTPWIISNLMLTAVHMHINHLPAMLERACIMLDRWLVCIPEDGGCDEGAGYWSMAGGALLNCLQVLEHITNGQVTFWHDEKIRRILSFPAKVRITGDWFVNFADCDAKPLVAGDVLQYAGEKLEDPALTAMGVELRGNLAMELSDTPHLSRALFKLFHREAESTAIPDDRDTWLPDLQVRLVRRGGMVLCAKAGHNNDNHNHNDVGSFMLYLDGESAIVDAGNMVYTAKTFSAERYTLWNVRAAYHNLPMIGRHEQQPGQQYAARDVQCLPYGLALDMANAYDDQAGITVCQRTLTLTEAGLVLQDRIELRDDQPVTWVFMLRNKPEIGQGELIAGKLRLAYDHELRAQVEELPITDSRMSKSFPGSLWRVLLTGESNRQHVCQFVVSRR